MNTKKTMIISAIATFTLYILLQFMNPACGITAEQYANTWFSFNAEAITQFHHGMSEKGTLQTYRIAHGIDLVFAFSFAVFFSSLFTHMARRSNKPFFSKANRWFASFAIGEAIFDWTETSLVLYATFKSTEIPGWLVMTQGAANIIKFFFFFGVVGWAFILVLRWIIGLIRRSIQIQR